MLRFEEYLVGVQRFGIRPGLERIRALLALAQQPHTSYPHILVGGTNGKGSTAQFLAHMLASPNRRIGLYTSPHLHRWNERIQILRADTLFTTPQSPFPDAISDADLDALFADAWPLTEQLEPEHGPTTEFELMTLLGLWHFERAHVDAAVIEVGLGGQWDATNAADPLVSVVTHVALDHCDRLGSTLEQIAADKINIARAGRVLVTAEKRPKLLEIFRAHCDSIGARLWPWQQPEFSNDQSALKAVLQIDAPHTFDQAAPPFQLLNLRTAQVAHRAFLAATGWPASNTDIKQAWSVPGRFEAIAHRPEIILDGANNPDGVAHLIEALQAARSDQNGRVLLVMGVSSDKDFDTMLQLLAPHADYFIATEALSPRALSAADLAQIASKYFEVVETVASVPAALQRARDLAYADDWIIVTGSFFVLGEVER